LPDRVKNRKTGTDRAARLELALLGGVHCGRIQAGEIWSFIARCPEHR